MIDFTNAEDMGSPEPISIPKIIGGKKYVLKEASEATHGKVKSLMAKGTTVSPGDGKVTIGTHVGEVEALLVSECLWECNSETGEPLRLVGLAAIKTWSPRIVHPLSEEAERISGMKAPNESPERKALLKALCDLPHHPTWLADSGIKASAENFLSAFREWFKTLHDVNPSDYEPLWRLVAPKEEQEFDPKK